MSDRPTCVGAGSAIGIPVDDQPSRSSRSGHARTLVTSAESWSLSIWSAAWSRTHLGHATLRGGSEAREHVENMSDRPTCVGAGSAIGIPVDDQPSRSSRSGHARPLVTSAEPWSLSIWSAAWSEKNMSDRPTCVGAGSAIGIPVDDQPSRSSRSGHARTLVTSAEPWSLSIWSAAWSRTHLGHATLRGGSAA